MRKLIVLCLVALVTVSMAGIKSLEGYSNNATYVQFTHNDLTNTGNYRDGQNPGQNWLGAQTIMLTIDSEMDLWFSNYISSWYYPKPMTNLDGNIYDMSAELYGVFNSEQQWLGNGQTATVTYFDDGTGITNSTDAYYVGHFNGGETVYLMMTTLPEDGAETIDSRQYVFDSAHDTTLWSRLDNTYDLAGNVRINFGLEDYVAHEFVAFGVSEPGDPPSGQPLPSTLATCLIAGSVIPFLKRRKQRK